MKPAFLLCACIPLLWSCFENPSTAGTNDETTTSLQILADNVKSFPSQTSSSNFAARSLGRLSEVVDTSWSLVQFEDHQTWSGWRMISRSECVPLATDTTQCSTQKLSHTNLEEAFVEAVDFTIKDPHGTVSISSTSHFQNRTGFTWDVSQTIKLKQSGEWGQGLTRTGRLDFPAQGWHCEFAFEEDEANPRFIEALARGIPLLSGTRPIGKFSIDSATGTFQWFDLAGKQYLPTPVAFRPNAADSLGLRVLGLRRDSLGGQRGVVIEGRFALPVRYGLVSDSVSVWAYPDSVSRPTRPTPEILPAPNGRFSLFLPTGTASMTDSSWISLEFAVHNASNPDHGNGTITSARLKIR